MFQRKHLFGKKFKSIYFFNAKYEPIKTSNIDNNNSIPGSSAKRIQAKITPKIGWNKLKKVTFPGKYVFKT